MGTSPPKSPDTNGGTWQMFRVALHRRGGHGSEALDARGTFLGGTNGARCWWEAFNVGVVGLVSLGGLERMVFFATGFPMTIPRIEVMNWQSVFFFSAKWQSDRNVQRVVLPKFPPGRISGILAQLVTSPICTFRRGRWLWEVAHLGLDDFLRYWHRWCFDGTCHVVVMWICMDTEVGF